MGTQTLSQRPRWMGTIASVLICAAALGTNSAHAAEPATLDALTSAHLRAMSNTVGEAASFKFVADTSLDEFDAAGHRTQLSNHILVTVQRPDKLHVEARGDIYNLDLWFDGKTLTTYDVDARTWSSLRFRGHIEKVLDFLAEKHGATFPLADFLVDDIYQNFVNGLGSGKSAGKHVVSGQPSHHMVFSQESVDWQLWTSLDHLPRKLVIAYKKLPGTPQYTAVFHGWELGATTSKATFVPAIPRDARRTEFSISGSAPGIQR